MGRGGPTADRADRREAESRALAEGIDAASVPEGGALLVRGEPGIGKSSLLEAAKTQAAGRHLQILTTTGVQSESRLPFAGLPPLIHPLLDQIDRKRGGAPARRSSTTLVLEKRGEEVRELVLLRHFEVSFLSLSTAIEPGRARWNECPARCSGILPPRPAVRRPSLLAMTCLDCCQISFDLPSRWSGR